MDIQIESAQSLGILLFFRLVQEIRLSLIVISDAQIPTFQNYKDTNKKYVDLSGLLTNSNSVQEEMITKS